MFPFESKHKLFKTPQQQICSQQLTPVPIFHPLAAPPPLDTNEYGEELPPSDLWLKQAQSYAEYYLVLHRPWTAVNGHHPGELSWNELCRFVEQMENTYVNQIRLRMMQNKTWGLRIGFAERKLVQLFRNRAADI